MAESSHPWQSTAYAEVHVRVQRVTLISAARRDTGTPAIDPDVKKLWRIAGNTGAVGIEVAVAIIIGYLGGRFLDRKLGTEPWISYAGLLAGIGAAIKALLRVIRSYRRDNRDVDDAETSDPQGSEPKTPNTPKTP